MDFKSELQNRIEACEEIIYRFLPEPEGEHKLLLEAMNYSVKAGGKRLRPILLQECYLLCGGRSDSDVVRHFMAAIEMVHTYSLVHDDLPAMDNDEYRRGKETTWKVFGEDIAILAGDALLNYAFETAMLAYKDALFDIRIAQALYTLAQKAGVNGMIGGQTIDVINENHPISKEVLNQIYHWKTGALLEASMSIGAILAGASEEQVEIIRQVAADVGMAFQIQDDILDVTSTPEVLGKPIGSDEKNQKVTYVTLYGVEEASRLVEKYMERACEKIRIVENAYPKYNAEFLNELLNWLAHRNK